MTDSAQRADSSRIMVSIDSDLEEIVPGFLDNRRKDVVALQTALSGNDFKTVRLLGHRMKGDGGGYGFETISAIGEALEQAAMREDSTTTKLEISKLSNFLACVHVVYRK